MNALPHTTPALSAPAAIDPAKAWMLGLVVEDDGSLRAAPTAPLAFGRVASAAEREREPLTCTCPDYCEIEHDAI